MQTALFPKDHIYHAALATKKLREAVPSVNAIDFSFLTSEKGYVKSIIPLNEFSSNQHGTHQALLLSMGGDYTGGLALATLLDDEPILGVYEISNEKAMSLWLLGSNMEFLNPSTEDVYLEAKIDPALSDELKQKYHSGGTIILDVAVIFTTKLGVPVARGTFKYYCKKKSALSVAVPGKRINAMYEHILKTSAKLIAYLRANEAVQQTPLFVDEISKVVAGKQGKVIADRFLKTMPELQHMVSARTHHLDLALIKYAPLVKQIVFVGVGLDFRAIRLNDVLGQKAIFELDLKEMLEERVLLEKIYALRKPEMATPNRIGCNFLTESIAEKLTAAGFDKHQPAFFIFEGCSMYFQHEDNKKILTELQQLMVCNSDSLLWMDKVHETALAAPNQTASLQSFLSGMAKLGEPFIFGFDETDSLLHESGLRVISSATTTNLKQVPHSDIYELYSFNILKACDSNTEG